MKKLLILFLLMLFPLMASADAMNVEVDGVSYYLVSSSETKTATITANRNYYSGLFVIPESVLYEGVTYKVTSIGNGAFWGCRDLISVTIPNSVTIIEDFAFGECGLISITIPNSVSFIGEGNFDGTPWYENQPDGLIYLGKVLYKYKGSMPHGTNVSIEEGTLGIAGGAFKGCSGLTSVTIPNSVTSIGGRAFSNCSGLTSLTIPNSVTSIGELSFLGCSGLTSVAISNNVTSISFSAFAGCSGLTSVTIPNSVTIIDDMAFSDRSGLTSLTIPNSVTSIGGMAFPDCSGLTQIKVEEGNTIYDSRGNCNAIIETQSNMLLSGCRNTVIPNSVTSIADNAFYGCSGLTSVAIPNSVTTIGQSAFFGCSNLTSVTISNNVTSISYSAFTGCSGLTSVTIPNSVTIIDVMAFSGCGGLTSLTIPNSVTSIGGRAFSNCCGLTQIKVGEGNTIYDSRGNCNAIIETQSNMLLSGCRNTVIPNSVTSIADDAFRGCSGLTSVTIPNSVTTIGKRAFMGCSGLTSVTIPDGVTVISKCAFEGCRGLTSVTIHSRVAYIGDEVFYDCSELKDVYCYAENVPKIDGNPFSFNENATLHVPESSIDAYKADRNWNRFKEIVALVDENIGTATITISSAKQVTYMSDKDLDFTGYPDLKAYVATGYDKNYRTIWLTRVKEVPANTGFLLMGDANTYEIPAKAGGQSSYYQNLFKGTIEGTTIQTTEGDNTNYYLSNGDAGVGFYKVQGSVELKPNRAYLSVPTEIPAVGAAGSTETIKVSAAGQVPYYNSQSLDFTSMEAQGVKAYTATGYDYSSGTIWLTRVKQVPAKTGILIMAPEGEYPVPTASVASVYANMFKGTLTGTTIQPHETIADEDYINYYLSSGDAGVGFYKVTKEGGVTIGANRCYLPIKNKEAAGTRSANSDLTQIAFEEADEVIGIPLLRGIGDGNGETTDLTPALSDGEGEGAWYTLQGQRVAKPGKGLYIRNGRKVVIK